MVWHRRVFVWQDGICRLSLDAPHRPRPRQLCWAASLCMAYRRMIEAAAAVDLRFEAGEHETCTKLRRTHTHTHTHTDTRRRSVSPSLSLCLCLSLFSPVLVVVVCCPGGRDGQRVGQASQSRAASSARHCRSVMSPCLTRRSP